MKSRRLRARSSAVKQALVPCLALLVLSACADADGDGDGGDRWNRAGMKIAAKASALRHRFDDQAEPDSARLAAGRELLPLDAEFLASRYHEQPLLVRAIIDAAVATGDTACLPLVARLFVSSDGEARIDFEVDLIAFGAAAHPRLVDMLRHTDRTIVVGAADALAKGSALAAVPEIAALLGHADGWIRMGAAHALGQLPSEKATEALLSALSDTTYAVVNAALVGLASQRAVAAYEPALALLIDGRPEVRKHAAHTLGQLGMPQAREILNRVSHEDPDSGVRFMATRALQSLDDAD